MTSPLEHQDLILRLIPSCKDKNVLDCGCGKGLWGYMIRCLKGEGHIIGIDLEIEFLKFVKKFRIYDDLILCDIRRMPFREKFDIVIAMQVIEHLPKHDGIKFLEEVKQLAKERIIVTTPNGFYGPTRAFEGFKTQAHLSGWTAGELRKLGFHVRGFGVRIRYLQIPYLYGLLDNILTPFAYFLTPISGFLIAYLDLK